MMDISPAKQVTNRLETGTGMPQAVDLLGEIINRWDEKNNKPIILLRALIALTKENPDIAQDGFTTLQIVEAVRDIDDPLWGRSTIKEGQAEDEDNLRKLVTKNWKILDERYWPAKLKGITEYFVSKKFSVIPNIEKIKGGGRANVSLYCLRLIPLNDEEKLNSSVNIKSNEIQYFTDDLETPSFIGSLFKNGYQLQGWRRNILLSNLLVNLIVIVAWILLSITFLLKVQSIQTFTGTILFIILGIIFYLYTLHPLQKLVNNRINFAPWWLQKGAINDDRVLEFRRNKDKEINALYLSRYSATCLKCGCKIYLNSGGKEFHNRIIGRCEKNPIEHVYSFDHVLRKGKDLRI